ncbi:Peptidyl-prolyl cis-trans isomerase FKBP5 [Tupaia chinensis]|uniref:peptidylprolyl isomerase n=1 Tax=Tupaia chinensis TaxID=246437 RepID=L9L448_TUPCH|nr:Peptidyl-prolyl cis-trans isomerase FKBP5 [Tupaia chinensis]
MTTDEGAKNNGESPAAAVAERGEDITSKKDRGVLKVIKRVGNSEEKPMIGDKVYVHYKGKLSNGKKFDSSHDRNEPFVFSLGKGQVIKAWDIGVSTMKKGEICHLLCKPEYAYGSAGSLPKIPSNATLFFEASTCIELLDFKGEDLFEDGGIIRRIKRKGEGYSNPNEGATVEIHLEGRCDGRMFDCRDVVFVVGEGEDHDIPIGIDKALEKMQREEQCILCLGPRYGFGEAGKPKFGIEPNAELLYEVTLKSFEKGGKYLQAVIQYGKIVSWLEMEYGLSEKESKASESFLLAAFLNLAMCYLKLREYTKAVECCDKALGLDSANEKGLYRRGEAQLLMNEFESAKGDFEKVLEVNPQNKAARLQISVCQKKAKEHNERDRRTYANMFKKFAEQDAKASAEPSANEKGLYRRGEAQLLMNEFESAKGDFEKVLEVNPQNKAARLQISVCQKKAKEHNERDRRTYANMFKKFAEQDAKASAEPRKRPVKQWARRPRKGSPKKKERGAKRWSKRKLKAAAYDATPGREGSPNALGPSSMGVHPTQDYTVFHVKFVLVCVILEADGKTSSFPQTTTLLLPRFTEAGSPIAITLRLTPRSSLSGLAQIQAWRRHQVTGRQRFTCAVCRGPPSAPRETVCRCVAESRELRCRRGPYPGDAMEQLSEDEAFSEVSMAQIIAEGARGSQVLHCSGVRGTKSDFAKL